MSTFDEQPTLADRLRLQAIQPASETDGIEDRQAVADSMATVSNAGYWADRQRKEKAA